MANCARIFLAFINLVMLVYSVLYIYVVAAFKNVNPTRCFDNTYNMHLWLAIFMLVISIIGIIGSCCLSKSMQSLYTWVAVIATITASAFVAFLSTTFPKESAYDFRNTIEGTPDGNWLEGYSLNLRMALVDDKSWLTIKTCLVELEFCELYKNRTAQNPDSDFVKKFHFPELGCCHPPSRCGLSGKSESGEYEISDLGSKDLECQTWWSSYKVDHCYDCDSCKAGFIAKDHDQWQSKKGFYIAFIVFLVITTLMSCYAQFMP